MHKFLKLIEENTPGVSYIVEIKDPDGTLLGSAAIPDNANTSFYEEIIGFLEDYGGEVVAVNSRPPAEDESDPSETAVAEIQPGGAEAVQRRSAIDNKILQTYNNETQELFNLQSQM